MIISTRHFLNFTSTAVLFLLISAAAAAGQNVPVKQPSSISTSGEAVVTAKPDRAQIDVGVVTQAVSSQAAVAQNAQKLESTLAKLRGLLGANADIKTISYSVTPDYRYPKEGGEPTIAGYSANNIVRVTLDDLTKVGSVIDTASQAGSNRIQNLRFMLKDDAAIQAQALRQAAMQARRKAEALASALDLRIIRVLSVSESGAPAYPVRDVAFARAEAASTPIEPGTIEIRASVALIVEVS